MDNRLELLDAVINSVAEHLAIIDAAGIICYVNQTWVDFGTSNACSIKPTDWLGVNYLNACDEAGREGDRFGLAASDLIRQVIAGKRDSGYLEYPCHSPVEDRWFMMRIKPLHWDGPPHFSISHHNITERKQAESVLKERESSLAKFKATLDQTLDCVFIFDADTLRFTYCNRGACEHVGYSQAELFTMTPVDIKPEFTEASYRALLKPLLDGEERVRVIQTIHRNKYGHTVPVEVSLQYVQTPGQRPHFVTIVRDITARRQAEEQFRLVVEAAPNGMLMVNQDGCITLVNPQIERWFGYHRTELVGQPIELLVPERLRAAHPGHRSAFFHNPQTRAMGVGRDLYGRRKDGSEFPLEIGLSPLATPQGQQVLAVVVDISERKRADEQLQAAAQELAWKNTQLLEANDVIVSATHAKSEFLATMSHEIRTPMNAIIGMAELLQETPLSPDQANYVGRFSRAANSLMDLINAILDLSKIESGHMTLESIPFDLPQLIDTIAELMSGKAVAKQLELLVFIHPDVPAWVLGDPTRLHQILVNLVGNAIKFTESGHVMIKVERAGEHSSAQALRFSVSDTGVGIPPEKLETIFEPFTQADSTTTRKYGGTGLGLNISQRLVDLMGGRLTVDSALTAGSTFAFVIELPETSTPPTQNTEPLLNIQGRRILAVDDNDTNLMILREHLTRTGAQLIEAASAESALKLLVEAHRLGDPFDLAILDYHMLVMDGLQLAEAIRARPECATLPLVMHVSELQQGDRQRAQALGIKNYLYKPLSRRRLMESLTAALNPSAHRTRRNVVDQPEPALLKSCHILLVEDLEDNREVVSLFLNKTSHQLDMAENGAVAVQKFKANRYDLVLMDMQMPVMDGLQATMVIREWERAQRRHPTPIVALTANAFAEETEKSLSAGCTAHVSKPIKKKTLLATITQLLKDHEDQDDG